MTGVPVNPELLRWARRRANLAQADLAAKFRKLPEWERGETRPTLRQVEAFARRVHVPVGYLFMSAPPEETVPIPDFRTVSGQGVTAPSPNLLDTIYACQERQNWYRDFARAERQPELPFVASATVGTPPETVAARMNETLGFHPEARRKCRTWEEALRLFVRHAEDAGVLAMTAGVALGNNWRPLDPGEFRGFALSDPLAPLVFVNGADTKAAQMFTLAHELAHLWLGASALSNSEAAPRAGFRREEVWCNAVAAEMLAPLAAVKAELREGEALPDALRRLARIFKVSNLVVLRRMLDANWLDRDRFDAAWAGESADLRRRAAERPGKGGNFYRTSASRVGRRFARALVTSTLEGRTLYRDAFRMLGVSKTESFDKLGREVGAIQ